MAWTIYRGGVKWGTTRKLDAHACHDLHTVQHFYAGKLFYDCIEDSKTPPKQKGILGIILSCRVATEQSAVYRIYKIVEEIRPTKRSPLVPRKQNRDSADQLLGKSWRAILDIMTSLHSDICWWRLIHHDIWYCHALTVSSISSRRVNVLPRIQIRCSFERTLIERFNDEVFLLSMRP